MQENRHFTEQANALETVTDPTPWGLDEVELSAGDDKYDLHTVKPSATKPNEFESVAISATEIGASY